VNTKDKEDSDKLLVAVTDILKNWCNTCRYKDKSKKEQDDDNTINSDSKTTYTYFIQQNNWVKIGSSTDPIRRAESLSHYTPHKTHLLYYTAQVTESDMHKKFQSLRTKGEWFSYTQEIKTYIQSLIKKDYELELEQEAESIM